MKSILVLALMAIVLCSFSFAATPVSSCFDISSSDTYDLASPITATSPTISCINITASNVVFDCHGFSITNNDISGPAFLLDHVDNVTILNCGPVAGFLTSFDVTSSTNVNISNTIIKDLGSPDLSAYDTIGINLYKSSFVSASNIQLDNYNHSIYASGSSSLNLRNFSLHSARNGSTIIYLESTDNSNLTSFSISSSYDNYTGIIVDNSPNNQFYNFT